jgi:hypothetical protein
MTTLKRPPAHTDNLALWTWIFVALTPLGWFSGFLAIAYSHLGDVTDVGMMTTGVVLFVEAPAIAVVLAVYAARAGHRSGKIAVVVSGLLLLAALVFLTLVYWWIGLPATGVVAVLVLAGVRSRRIAVAVFGSLLLVTLSFIIVPWWIGKVVTAVIAVPVFLWVRSRSKPRPPGPDGVPHEGGPHAVTAPPGASGRTSWLPNLGASGCCARRLDAPRPRLVKRLAGVPVPVSVGSR